MQIARSPCDRRRDARRRSISDRGILTHSGVSSHHPLRLSDEFRSLHNSREYTQRPVRSNRITIFRLPMRVRYFLVIMAAKYGTIIDIPPTTTSMGDGPLGPYVAGGPVGLSCASSILGVCASVEAPSSLRSNRSPNSSFNCGFFRAAMCLRGGDGIVNPRRAHRSIPINTGLSRVGSMLNVCRNVFPCTVKGRETRPGILALVPSARWISSSPTMGRIRISRARRAVSALIIEISDPESSKAGTRRSNRRIVMCGRGVNFTRSWPRAVAAFPGRGWQSWVRTPSFPHCEQKRLAGRRQLKRSWPRCLQRQQVLARSYSSEALAALTPLRAACFSLASSRRISSYSVARSVKSAKSARSSERTVYLYSARMFSKIRSSFASTFPYFTKVPARAPCNGLTFARRAKIRSRIKLVREIEKRGLYSVKENNNDLLKLKEHIYTW